MSGEECLRELSGGVRRCPEKVLGGDIRREYPGDFWIGGGGFGDN